MVLRCAWGTCNGDVRYLERQQASKLIPFPKPKTQLQTCLRWIKACGRPHHQLNINRINKHKAVCAKHFIGEQGPTPEHPDPIPADGTPCKPVRSAPKKRRLCEVQDENRNPEEAIAMPLHHDNIVEAGQLHETSSTQTMEAWISPLEMLSLAAENTRLQAKIQQKERTISWLRKQLQQKEERIVILKKENLSRPQFSIEEVIRKESRIKGVFKYYTGISYISFMALLSFLTPNHFKLDLGKGRTDLRNVTYKNGLFFTLCRLRHDFGLKDLSVRFGLSTQSASVLFKTWINHMYFKLGQVSIWPHRDVIIRNMPKNFKKEFPRTLVIIDGTEFKTQVPAALGLQSQMFSDYKSSTTLKALIGCDPNGSVIFVSELFTGSVSDKALTAQSGFYELLQDLKDNGYVDDGDCVMADKGFTIHNELKNLGLHLNIPPFAATGSQMSQADVESTQKIARHRVHIERLIRKVKTYKILSNVIPTHLFPNINQIWSVCCFLTLFQDCFVTDK